jgi:hypothetical protein
MKDDKNTVRSFLPYADYVPYIFWPILVWPVMLLSLVVLVLCPPKFWRDK